MINPWSHDVSSLTCFEVSASHFATKTPNILCCRRRHHRWSFDLCHLAFLVCGPAEEELRCGAASTNPSREHQLNPERNFKILFHIVSNFFWHKLQSFSISSASSLMSFHALKQDLYSS